MNHILRKGGLRLLLASAAIAAFLLASAQAPTAIQPPPGNTEVLRAYGEGVQIYVSRPSATNPGQFVWAFVAPDATLYNNGGHIIGHHYVGPTWEANNGSLVVATKIAAVTPDPTAIPWLLLRGVSHGGHGMFSDVSYVQRLDTTGGLAPSWTPTAAGIEVDVPYTATYVFFEPITP
jgi:hypothetical protein